MRKFSAHANEIKLRENIAAISAVFHGNQRRCRYQEFYDKHGESFDGFPGIWKYCVDAAIQFSYAELDANKAGVEFEWVDAVDAFVNGMFKENAHFTVDLRKLADTVIHQNSMEGKACASKK